MKQTLQAVLVAVALDRPGFRADRGARRCRRDFRFGQRRLRLQRRLLGSRPCLAPRPSPAGRVGFGAPTTASITTLGAMTAIRMRAGMRSTGGSTIDPAPS